VRYGCRPFSCINGCRPVRQSKNTCLVGLSGIVFHETENAFKIVTKDDKIKRQSSRLSYIAHLINYFPPFSPAQAKFHLQLRCSPFLYPTSFIRPFHTIPRASCRRKSGFEDCPGWTVHRVRTAWKSIQVQGGRPGGEEVQGKRKHRALVHC